MISIENLSYTYPFQDRPALQNISLKADKGQAILLAGPSGGGKSTILRVINGLIPHLFAGKLQGRAMLNNCDTSELEMREISAFVSTLFQDPEKQFLALKVHDEISFALEWRLSCNNELTRRVDETIADFSLEQLQHASVYELSEGQKQKVALASLAALRPEILVLDEPTANLDRESAMNLARHLLRLKRSGTTLVIADHRLAWLEGLIDQVYIVDSGRITASGSREMLQDDQLRRDNSLRAITWPEELNTKLCDGIASDSNTLIRWEDLSFSYRGRETIFDNINIGIPAGSVTAMTGDNGCGKTTFARLVAGLIKPRQGILYKNGQSIHPARMLKTTAMAMQNSELQLHQRSCVKELIHAVGDPNYRLDETAALSWLQRFSLTDIANRHPQSLSGGQKQRLVVACAAARANELLILDEPTSGLDGGQMLALADLLQNRSNDGKATLVITHDLELIERVCTHEINIPLLTKRQNKQSKHTQETT